MAVPSPAAEGGVMGAWLRTAILAGAAALAGCAATDTDLRVSSGIETTFEVLVE